MDYFSAIYNKLFIKEEPQFKKPDGYKNINASSTQKK